MAKLAFDKRNFVGIRVRPANFVTFQEPKVRVVLKSISATNFNEGFGLFGQAFEDVLDNTVFIALGIDFESMVGGVPWSLDG